MLNRTGTCTVGTRRGQERREDCTSSERASPPGVRDHAWRADGSLRGRDHSLPLCRLPISTALRSKSSLRHSRSRPPTSVASSPPRSAAWLWNRELIYCVLSSVVANPSWTQQIQSQGDSRQPSDAAIVAQEPKGNDVID
jgi:hypothetical protein